MALNRTSVVVAAVVGIIGGAIAGGIAGGALSAKDTAGFSGNICSFSRNEVLTHSKVGKSGTQQLQKIVRNVQGQLNTENAKLQADLQKFQKQSGSMKKAARKKKEKALGQRQREYKAKVQNVSTRVRYTRNKVTQGINQKIDPLLNAAYKAHACGVLLNQGAVLAGNQYINLTGTVTQALNKSVSTVNFTLLQLPKKASAQRAEASR